jgi:hypothetical protein
MLQLRLSSALHRCKRAPKVAFHSSRASKKSPN